MTHGIDLDNDYMTVQEFIELTKDRLRRASHTKACEAYDRKKRGYVQHVRHGEGKKVETFRNIVRMYGWLNAMKI